MAGRAAAITTTAPAAALSILLIPIKAKACQAGKGKYDSSNHKCSHYRTFLS